MTSSTVSDAAREQRGQSRPRGLRRDIQGLRAIAVLGVVGDHFLHWPDGGFVGVDVFFVISGYLITGLLLREFERRQTISFTGFYMRRAKRILPAALFVLGTTTCLAFALVGISRFRTIAKDVLASAFFGGNWEFARTGVDYFQQGLPPSPVQHFWSLGVEEQFYLVWPWLLLGLLLLGMRLRWWRHTHVRQVAGIAIVLITVASLAWALRETVDSPTYAYFSTFARAWELGVGAFLAVVGSRLTPRSPTARTGLAWLGLVGIGVALLEVSGSSGFPAPWALLPTLATALVIVAGPAGEPAGIWPLTSRGAQWFGERSYSLYLWHFPVVVLLQTLVADKSLPYYVVGAVLMLGATMASYRFIEEPARRADWFRWTEHHRLRGLRAGWAKYAAAAAAIAVISGGLTVATHSVAPAVAAAPPVVPVGHTEDDPHDCFGAAALDPRHDCALNAGDSVAPSPGDVPDDTRGAYTCYSFAGQGPRMCEYGPKNAPTKVALVGDSHAAALLPALEPQLSSEGWDLTTMFGNGCQWHPTPTGSGNCRKAMPEIQHRLETGGYDLVIATGSRSSDTAPVADHVAAIAPVAKTGTKVVVVRDDPSVSATSLDCVNRIGFSPARGCATPEATAYSKSDPLAAAAAQVPGVSVVDMRRFFCVHDSCPATIGNSLVYRDTAGHMTATFARSLSPYLVGAIANASTRPR